ncbi:hypothetical protein [Cognatiyoonia sp. IB215182]|uniref:hypothetical protein n=1 Tax=Cognatiyoonia sp. IB215182 TaxID=3097353 RepID=UPI002A1401D7|nr:hypothetical protein [Cognatiyoonia sp. IB215182]MDX8351781.1 hypothetical protein [Cognatiyoonia sp. IB215182]
MRTPEFTEQDVAALEHNNRLFWDKLNNESDLGMVLSAGAYFENLLSRCTKRYFLAGDVSKGVMGAGGPLGSFSALLDCNYLLRIIDADQRTALKKLAKIRNVFAHELQSSFDETSMADRVDDYAASYVAPEIIKDMGESKKSAGEKFSFTSFVISMDLSHREIDVWMHTLGYSDLIPPHLDDEIRRSESSS